MSGKDRLAGVFQDTWKQLMEQGRNALDRGDGAGLLRVEGGRAVLMHIAAECGYSTDIKVEEKKDGPQGAEVSASNKSGRRSRKKKTS